MMKLFPFVLTLAIVTCRAIALDTAAFDAIHAKFSGTTPEKQHQARVELNRWIDQATAPGSPDAAAALKAVVASIESATVPIEAKKYLLRALARVGGPEIVPSMRCLLAGNDALLREEARQVLAVIPGDESRRALEEAHTECTDESFRSLLSAALDARAHREPTAVATPAAALLAVLADRGSSERALAIERALAGDDDRARHIALRAALDGALPSLIDGLAGNYAGFPTSDRIVVLQRIDQLPIETGEALAMQSTSAADPKERVAAVRALGRIPTQAAFDAALQALGAREPAVHQAAGLAVGSSRFDGADAQLASLVGGEPSPDALLAIKALAHRALPDSGAILLRWISSDDEASAKEAMRALYFTATIDDLRALCDAARSRPEKPATLTSLCTRIADRLDTEEARAMAAEMK